MSIVSGRLLLNRKGEVITVAIAVVQGTLQSLGVHLNRLHPEEKSRYDSFTFARRKESYLLGRLSAKAALTQLTGFMEAGAIFIDSGVFDFPVVRCPALPHQQVSISHCEGISVSVAFPETHPIGIDIEHVTGNHLNVMRDQVTKKEESLLNSVQLNDIRGYAMLWGMKESLSKVIRTGMTIDMMLMEVNTLSQKGAREYEGTFSQFGQYHTFSSCLGDHVIAMTFPKKSILDFSQVAALFGKMNDDHNGCQTI